MPATTPPIAPAAAGMLARLGGQLRAARKRQKVAAVAAAQAAGISRVTLHRIERGEPTVAIGAWAAAARALGLDLTAAEPGGNVKPTQLPRKIRLSQYPQLKQLAWQLPGVTDLSPREALDLYERNWRHVDAGNLSAREAALIKALTAELGGGRLLV